ncbi:coiled-coil domain-containing protein 181-like [Mizuhopecten yessoensis]|uniref:coiled-coil domain-containing protein 181-like n=1 Tax=Mizuhopecten yessoensis TaxID=6573 RepID=UPI000B45BC8C|nr:coiled-coil domain-containing protein 181-like [Mizuhopecten yessoensis]
MSTSQSQSFISDEEDDLDKELDAFIEEKTEPEPVKETKEDKNVNEPPKSNNIASDSEGETEEKGQRETSGEKSTDDEWDEQELSEDQKRAMMELENLRNMDDGLPTEDPPEYDVTARVKQLNEELANDTTPTDKKRESRVLFKEDLVDLVAPPPDYGEGEEGPQQNQESNTVSDKSETSKNNSNTPPGTKRSDNKVLIERGGNFELVNADEVTADDMGIPLFDNDKENEDNISGAGNTNNNNSSSSFNRKPAPPSNPRPSTATGPSRRSMRPAQKTRAQSAGSRNTPINHSFPLNANYRSPYALSLKEKDMLEQQNKQKEEQRREDERRRKRDEEDKQSYNEDLFQSWLSKVRQREKQKKEKEEEEMRKNQKPDKRRSKDKQKNMGQDEYDNSDDEERSQDKWEDDDYSDETQKNNELFKEWVQTKSEQKKREKLLSKRQEQETNEGLIIRSRDDCDKAFRDWLRRKSTDLKRARAIERQKARMMRIAARKARKTQALTKAVRQSNAFRYVDYYGYRF